MAAQKRAKKGLGRGFDSLIPTDVIQAEFDPTRETDSQHSQAQEVLIQDVVPNPEQPRKTFKQTELDQLAESIRLHGILQPIVLVRQGNKFMIIAGERRWRAAKQAGLTHIPAIVRSLDGQAKLEVALIENVQREDLTPLEMATAIHKLEQQFNMTHKTIAQRVGKGHSTVSNLKRLLKLPEPAKRALNDLRITEQHARAILALDGDPQKQQELLDLILRHGWTAPRAEQFVVAIKRGATTPTEAVKRTSIVNDDTKRISKRIKADVHVRHMAEGGQLIIRYKDDKDFKRLSDLLGD